MKMRSSPSYDDKDAPTEDHAVVNRILDEPDEIAQGAEDAFAAQGEGVVHWKSMGWIRAGFVALAESIALGTLSFPSIFMRVGVVGGVVLCVAYGSIAYLTAVVMVDFKLRHPQVMNYADAGQIIFGQWGFYVLGAGMFLKSIGLCASHVLVGKQALNYFSDNATCSIVFAMVVAVASILMSVQRTWGGLTGMSIVSVSSILIAAFITVVGVAVQDPTRLEKNGVPVQWKAVNTDATLIDVIGALTNVMFAYGGNMACFSFLAEMRRPVDFKKSFLLNQVVSTVVYLLVGSIVYVYAGQYTTSPAFGSLGHTLRMTAYAIAFPCIMISGVLGGNVGAKWVYLTAFRSRPEILNSNGWRSWSWWMLIITSMWVAAFVLAELIPFFSSLLSIISSLFSTWFIAGLGALLWLHLYSPKHSPEAGGYFASPGRTVVFSFMVFLIVMSLAITPLGLYSAFKTIISGFANGTYGHPFSCAA
ncbi:hypothetical protein JCM8547_000635 [Rhodosporidiobolus lusitaniae]